MSGFGVRNPRAAQLRAELTAALPAQCFPFGVLEVVLSYCERVLCFESAGTVRDVWLPPSESVIGKLTFPVPLLDDTGSCEYTQFAHCPDWNVVAFSHPRSSVIVCWSVAEPFAVAAVIDLQKLVPRATPAASGGATKKETIVFQCMCFIPPPAPGSSPLLAVVAQDVNSSGERMGHLLFLELSATAEADVKSGAAPLTARVSRVYDRATLFDAEQIWHVRLPPVPTATAAAAAAASSSTTAATAAPASGKRKADAISVETCGADWLFTASADGTYVWQLDETDLHSTVRFARLRLLTLIPPSVPIASSSASSGWLRLAMLDTESVAIHVLDFAPLLCAPLAHTVVLSPGKTVRLPKVILEFATLEQAKCGRIVRSFQGSKPPAPDENAKSDESENGFGAIDDVCPLPNGVLAASQHERKRILLFDLPSVAGHDVNGKSVPPPPPPPPPPRIIQTSYMIDRLQVVDAHTIAGTDVDFNADPQYSIYAFDLASAPAPVALAATATGAVASEPAIARPLLAINNPTAQYTLFVPSL